MRLNTIFSLSSLSTLLRTAPLGAVVLALCLSSPSAHARKKRPKGKDVCAKFSAKPAKLLLGDGMKTEPSRYASLCTFKVRLPDAEAREKEYAARMQKQLMERMRSGSKNTNFGPAPRTDNRISLTWQGDQKSAKRAAKKMEQVRRTLSKGITINTKGNLKDGFKSKVKVGDGPEKSTPETDEVTDKVSRDVGKDLKEIERKAGGRDLPGARKDVSASYTAQSDIEILDVSGIDEAHYAEKYRNVTARKGKRIITVEVRLGKTPEEEKALALALATEWLNQK